MCIGVCAHTHSVIHFDLVSSAYGIMWFRPDHRPGPLPSIRPCFAPYTMIHLPKRGGCCVFLSLFIMHPLVLIHLHIFQILS